MTSTTGTRPAAVGPAAAAGSGVASTGRRVRGIALWAVAVVVGGLLIALAAGSSAPQDYLHPDGTGEAGTRALVQVLRDHGVDVEVVGTAADAVDAAGPGSTVVVGNSGLLTSTAARRLLTSTRSADRVVLLDGAPGVLPELDLGVAVVPTDAEPGAPECRAPWVRPGDTVTRLSFVVVATGEDLPRGARGCYPLTSDTGEGSGSGDTPAAWPAAATPAAWGAVDLPATMDHAPVTVVGFPDAATNRFVTEADHAGLVVRLLGASPRLVWYHPTADDLAANPAPADERPVWPSWTQPVLVVVALAFVAFAVARGRRLGRLVPEALPVVVRATETTESRAELYRAAGDRGRAASVLRRATSGRLAARLGLPPGGPHADLVAAVADAAALPAAQVDAVLRDVPPPDEAALVALAQQLAHLEEKVRST